MGSLMGVAGVISGAGQAAEKGLHTLQAGMTQRMLLDERYKLEGEMQSRNQEFLKGMQENTQDFQRDLQKGTQEFQRGLQQERVGADILLRGQDRQSQERIAEATNARLASEGQMDRTTREKIAGFEVQAAKDRLDFEKHKVTLSTDANGHVIKVDPTGKNLGYLYTGENDKDGKPIPVIVGKDMDARTKALVEVTKTLIAGDEAALKEAMRLGDTNEIASLKGSIARAKQDIDVLLGVKRAPIPDPGVDVISQADPFKKTPEVATNDWWPGKEQPAPTAKQPRSLMMRPYTEEEQRRYQR